MGTTATRPEGANDTALPADRVIVGAPAMAIEIYGPVDGKVQSNVRRINHALDKGDLPTFKLGGRHHIRRQALWEWVKRQESRA